MHRPFLKNKTSFALGLAFLMAFLGQSVRAQTSLPLPECISQALSTSPRLDAARSRLDASESSARASRAQRLPSLAATGTASYVSEVQSLNLPPNPLMPAGQSIQFGDNTSYSFALSLRAPLYAGGSLTSWEAANRYEATATERDLEADSLTVLYEVRNAYFRALAAGEANKLAHNALDRLLRHKQDVEHMQQAGMADEETMLNLLSHIREGEQRVAASEAILRSARLELGRVIGRTGEEIVADQGLTRTIVDSSAVPDASQRPDLEAFDLRSRSAERRVNAAKGSFLPTVSAVAAYNYGKPGVDYITNEWMGYATAGISLNWTVFDWSAREFAVQSVRATRNTLVQSQRALSEVWRTREQVAKARLESSRKEREAASSRLDLERRRYGLIEGKRTQGQASERDLLDAQDDLASAEISLAQAYSQERLAETELLYSTGR